MLDRRTLDRIMTRDAEIMVRQKNRDTGTRMNKRMGIGFDFMF